MPPDVPARCVTDRVVHFDVHKVAAGAAIPDGRIVVVFYQLDDDFEPPVPLFIGYEQVFRGASTGVDIAIADVALPPAIDDYYVCPRTCDDLSDAACDCPAAEPKLALAFVFVVRDADGSGAIEPAEVLVDDNRYGVGVLQLGASDAAYPVPNVLDEVVRDGVQDCLAPYSILPPSPENGFDDIGIPAPGATFRLDVCVPKDASCDDLETPNIT